MKIITVTEFARLTTESVDAPKLDRASLPVEDFQALCRLNERRQTGEAPLVQMQSRTTLRLCNYVGLRQSSREKCIEILQKTTARAESAERQRGLLLKMLCAVYNLPCRESGPAMLRTMASPLREWLIRQFLEALHALLRKGLCFSYNCTAEEKPFLRGRLDVGKQIVQPPQRRHLQSIRHYVFSVDSPEHRLSRRIWKTTLRHAPARRICRSTAQPLRAGGFSPVAHVQPDGALSAHTPLVRAYSRTGHALFSWPGNITASACSAPWKNFLNAMSVSACAGKLPPMHGAANMGVRTGCVPGGTALYCLAPRHSHPPCGQGMTAGLQVETICRQEQPAGHLPNVHLWPNLFAGNG